ncbi:MAG: hypothetical protein HY681_07005, partial [Chloroflexi bacterium]|nr:hypothetical protein [Chloroflexota bacterium]
EMEDGRTIGVMREGPMSPSSHLLRRLRSLQQGAYPRTLLVLAHDPVRLTEWRRTLDRSPFTASLALQDEVLHSGAGEAIWRSSFDPRPLPLDQVVRFARRDALPLEPPFAGGPCRPTTLKTPLRS